MNSDRVKVFHRTNGDHIACAVAKHFEFNFFPAVNVFFNQYLRDRREHKPIVRDRAQILFIICHAAARAADPLLTDTLLASLRAVRTHCEDDADLLRKIRRTLVHRLDGRFAAGNRDPLYAPGDKPA